MPLGLLLLAILAIIPASDHKKEKEYKPVFPTMGMGAPEPVPVNLFCFAWINGRNDDPIPCPPIPVSANDPLTVQRETRKL